MKVLKVVIALLSVVCLFAACAEQEEPGSGRKERDEEVIQQVETTEAVQEVTEVTEEQVTLEPVPETTEAARPGVHTTTYVVSQGEGYRIVRTDRSYYNADCKLLLEHYCDYVQLTANTEAARKINAYFEKVRDEHLWSEEEVVLDGDAARMAEQYSFCNSFTGKVTYISDNCVCVTLSMDWYMGGVYNGGTEGYVMSLLTGEPATLANLTDRDPAQLEADLKAIAWAQIEPQNPWENSFELLSAYTLDTFNFSIEEGEIVLHFAEYEFLPGAAGPISVHTGIYV